MHDWQVYHDHQKVPRLARLFIPRLVVAFWVAYKVCMQVRLVVEKTN